MKTLKFILVIAMLTAFSQQTFAQNDPPPGDRKEKDDKIEKLKIAFITTELNLTTEEAEKFWPIYNEAEGKIKEIRKSNRQIQKEIDSNYDNMSAEEAKKKMNALFENDSKEVQIRKEYSEKFIKVIGEKRALKLLSLEQEFKRELLDALRENGPQGPPPPPPHGQHRPNGRQ